MQKKGAFSIVGLHVFYLILAILIVLFTYDFLDTKTSDTLMLGYTSREIGLDVSTLFAAPGGEVSVKEAFSDLFYLEVKDGTFIVSKEEKEETYPFFPDGFYEDVPNEKLDINGTLLLLKNTEGVELQNE